MWGFGDGNGDGNGDGERAGEVGLGGIGLDGVEEGNGLTTGALLGEAFVAVSALPGLLARVEEAVLLHCLFCREELVAYIAFRTFD